MSKPDSRSLEQDIQRLLADASYEGHPLRNALEQVWLRYAGLAERLDRITHISDVYQSVMLERESDLEAQLDLHLRRLEKVARISDRYQMMMRELNAALAQASTHDTLTSLPNRRLLIARLKDETARSHRTRLPFSVAMLDLDEFKVVNDSFGHETGDNVLVAVARALESLLRKSDVCGRWGGEEFLLLLPGADILAATEVLARVRTAVSQVRVQSGDASLSVTVSAGLSMLVPGDDYATLVNRADRALIRAKRNGRDCLEVEI